MLTWIVCILFDVRAMETDILLYLKLELRTIKDRLSKHEKLPALLSIFQRRSLVLF